MSNGGGQKFISRNRKPRVHIEYKLKTGDAQKAIELPFVMGVMADLAGDSDKPQERLEKREFLEFEAENFDDRMAEIEPRVKFRVANKIDGDGELSVNLPFRKMDDFSPAAVARNVDVLNKILQKRDSLKKLLTYMDGKAEAEEWMEELLNNPEKLEAIMSAVPDSTADDTKEG